MVLDYYPNNLINKFKIILIFTVRNNFMPASGFEPEFTSKNRTGVGRKPYVYTRRRTRFLDKFGKKCP
ncbi:unnamed protein product [marine sediment metagenome]|uniref:Uncharacterized protein n=1 Tax=marine sediment metagenome TaxID=412755 RepID=X1F9X7_9ZZZZ